MPDSARMVWTCPKSGVYEWTLHYEISPREREDEQLRDERDFGTQEYDDEAHDEPQPWSDDA